MTRTEVVKKTVVDAPPFLLPGRLTYCAGCSYGTIMRILTEVLDELGIGGKTIVATGITCFSESVGFLLNLDSILCPHGRAPVVATAMKRISPESIIVTTQGDGDLGAIGLGHFMHAALRGENITILFLNNANYGMTGGQLAPTTPLGMRTTTAKSGRAAREQGFPLHVAELAASLPGVAYSARCSVHSAAQYQKGKAALRTAFQKQIDGAGLSIVEFLSACPTNWHMDALGSLKFIQESMIREYPLGVFKDVPSVG